LVVDRHISDSLHFLSRRPVPGNGVITNLLLTEGPVIEYDRCYNQMTADAAVSVPNPRQEIDLSSLFYNDSDAFGIWIQNTVFSKKPFYGHL
jgi:hypothetical protein